jgi:hypothetical protein
MKTRLQQPFFYRPYPAFVQKQKASLFYCLSFLLMLFPALAPRGVAQTAPLKEFDYRFGGSGGEFLQHGIQTADGGYILAGESQSIISGDKTQNPVGYYDYWIVKLDENGIKSWDKTLGGTSFDYLLCIDQTTDGGYILGGYSLSGAGGDKTQASHGDEDYWIVKTDASGNKLWDASFGGDSTDVLRWIQQTTDGGYILCGFTDSDLSGDISESTRGGRDYWVVKTDANGNKLWDKRFGGSDFDQGNYVEETIDGGFIFAGFSASPVSGDKSQGNQGFSWTYDYWIVKTDASGTKQWDARFGGTSYDYLYNMKQTADGGYILGGYSESGIGGDKTQPNWGSVDYWLVKTDANGAKLWDMRYGSYDSDYAIDIHATSDGGYLFSGFSDSDAGGDKSQDNWGVLYTYDYWIVKTDATGNKLWDARYGGTEWEQLGVAFETTDGGYFLAGYSNSPISGDKTQSSQGFDDYWVVKLACSTALIYYADADHDLFGDPGNSIASCEIPKGYITDSTDCDDTNPNAYPGAPEIPGNGIDDDCDGDVDEIGTGIDGWNAGYEDFIVFPNPTSGQLTISLNSPAFKDADVEIVNAWGSKVYHEQLDPSGENIHRIILLSNDLPDGLYWISLTANGNVYHQKILLQK